MKTPFAPAPTLPSVRDALLQRNAYIDRERARHMLTQVALIALLVGGMLLPTAIGGSTSTPLALFNALVRIGLLVALIMLNGTGHLFTVVPALLIPFLMAVATLTSPPGELAIGAFINYVPAGLLFMVNLRHVRYSRSLHRAFFMVSLITFAIGLAVVLDRAAADRFLVNWYSLFYAQLVPNMVAADKPVFSFSTHSIAAFMYFLLFLVALEVSRKRRSRVWFAVGLGYLALIPFLKSFSAIAMAALGIPWLLYRMLPRTERSLLWLLFLAPLLLAALAGVLFLYREPVAQAAASLQREIVAIVRSPQNGLLGRFGPEGVLGGNIAYIAENPLRPLGTRTLEGLWFVDNGPIEYVLRGSFPLLFAMYGGYAMFLWHNLRSHRMAVMLFPLTLLVEIGFSYLSYFRFQMLIPVFVVALNHLTTPSIATPRRQPAGRNLHAR